MTVYRATRNENRVGIGDFTRDFVRGQLYESGDERGQIPEYICDYLVSHGLLVDDRVADGPMDSPAPPVSPTPPVVKPLVQAKAGVAGVQAEAKSQGDK